MPLADLTDYSTDFFVQNIRSSFGARKEMGWDVPERLFRHFVLPLRANNENLDTSRVVFYRELKSRVEGMDMKDAILEVNHWCHEKLTYKPSDGAYIVSAFLDEKFAGALRGGIHVRSGGLEGCRDPCPPGLHSSLGAHG